MNAPVVPTIGRIVLYQTDGRGGYRYALPAMVVRTLASTDPKAVADGKVAALPNNMTVDLLVFSCDGESYGESAVPFGDMVACDGDGTAAYGLSRTWSWPPRVGA